MTNQLNNLNDMAILNGETEAPNDGFVAPLDGAQSVQSAIAARAPVGIDGKQPAASVQEALAKLALGPNNERLEELRPDLVNALREMVVQYREEGMVARRHEIRRIRQARLFWQGLQYAWWNPQDMTWNLPYESKLYDDSAAAEMPRYQFVTNLYQAFGLSFISILSQDVPATRFYPQSAQSIGDISAARAASQVCDLVEQNNRVQHLLTGVAFYLWTDGKIGGYVRYVADAQRFGSHDEPVIEEHYVALGDDAYVCPECGARAGNRGQGQGAGENLAPNPGNLTDSSFPLRTHGQPATCHLQPAPCGAVQKLRRVAGAGTFQAGGARGGAADYRSAARVQRAGSDFRGGRAGAEYAGVGQ